GLVAPAGTPQPIIEKLAAAVKRAVGTPELAERLQHDGIDPIGGTPAEFATLITREIAQWRGPGQSASITPDCPSRPPPLARGRSLGTRKKNNAADPHHLGRSEYKDATLQMSARHGRYAHPPVRAGGQVSVGPEQLLRRTRRHAGDEHRAAGEARLRQRGD